jgi:hypothetical protein
MVLSNPTYNDGMARTALEGYKSGNLTLILFKPNSTPQGTWAYYIENTHGCNGYLRNTSAADGDEARWLAYLDVGTYMIQLTCGKDSDYGIVDVEIDGVALASFDCYAAAPDPQSTTRDLDNVVATSGVKQIDLKVNGKNGSSTGYKCNLSCLEIRRQT